MVWRGATQYTMGCIESKPKQKKPAIEGGSNGLTERPPPPPPPQSNLGKIVISCTLGVYYI